MSCSSQNDSGLTRELVGRYFHGNLFRCTDYGPILRKIVFWQCRWTQQTTFGPILNASIGNLETEDRVREERGPFPVAVQQRQALSIEVFFCISEQQCSMKIDLSRLRGLQTLFQLRLCLRRFSSTLTQQSKSRDVFLSMPGRACEDVRVVMCD